MSTPITPDERAEWRERYTADLPIAWNTSVAAHTRALRDLGRTAREVVPRLLGALDAAEVEVARLRAEVRLAKASAWDEDSARCCTGDASQHDGHHKSCRYVHGDLRPDPDDRETLADAVLDLIPGRSEAEVKAEALREASDWLAHEYGNDGFPGPELRARADRLAAEGGADRG